MSSEAVGWVFRFSPLRGVAFQVHLAIADSVNDQNGDEFWMLQSRLATKARTTRGSVTRTMTAMVEGTDDHPPLLELITEGTGQEPNCYRFLFPEMAAIYDPRGRGNVRAQRARQTPVPARPARSDVRAQRASTRAPSAHRTQGVSQGVSQEPHAAAPPAAGALPLAIDAPAPPATGSIAQALVKRVWDRCSPKPATPFVGAVKIAERLLAAGWTAEQVEEAMVEAPTISTGAVELVLARHRDRQARTGPRSGPRIITDRDGPEGRIVL